MNQIPTGNLSYFYRKPFLFLYTLNCLLLSIVNLTRDMSDYNSNRNFAFHASCYYSHSPFRQVFCSQVDFFTICLLRSVRLCGNTWWHHSLVHCLLMADDITRYSYCTVPSISPSGLPIYNQFFLCHSIHSPQIISFVFKELRQDIVCTQLFLSCCCLISNEQKAAVYRSSPFSPVLTDHLLSPACRSPPSPIRHIPSATDVFKITLTVVSKTVFAQ